MLLLLLNEARQLMWPDNSKEHHLSVSLHNLLCVGQVRLQVRPDVSSHVQHD